MVCLRLGCGHELGDEDSLRTDCFGSDGYEACRRDFSLRGGELEGFMSILDRECLFTLRYIMGMGAWKAVPLGQSRFVWPVEGVGFFWGKGGKVVGV